MEFSDRRCCSINDDILAVKIQLPGIYIYNSGIYEIRRFSNFKKMTLIFDFYKRKRRYYYVSLTAPALNRLIDV